MNLFEGRIEETMNNNMAKLLTLVQTMNSGKAPATPTRDSTHYPNMSSPTPVDNNTLQQLTNPDSDGSSTLASSASSFWTWPLERIYSSRQTKSTIYCHHRVSGMPWIAILGTIRKLIPPRIRIPTDSEAHKTKSPETVLKRPAVSRPEASGDG